MICMGCKECMDCKEFADLAQFHNMNEFCFRCNFELVYGRDLHRYVNKNGNFAYLCWSCEMGKRQLQ